MKCIYCGAETENVTPCGLHECEECCAECYISDKVGKYPCADMSKIQYCKMRNRLVKLRMCAGEDIFDVANRYKVKEQSVYRILSE